MLEGLGISESQAPPRGGDSREGLSLEEGPRDQDSNNHIISGLLSKEEDTGPLDLEIARQMVVRNTSLKPQKLVF